MLGLILFGVLILVVICIVISNIKIVDTNTVLVIEYLGKFNRFMEAGFNLKTPFFERVAKEVSLRQSNFEVKGNYPSKDKVLVGITTNLIYTVDPQRVYEFVYSLTDSNKSIESVVENSLRTYVAKETHEGILEKKEELANHIKVDLEKQFFEWGIIIRSFQITSVGFPVTITDAMSQVVASEQLKRAAENKGEAIKIQAIKEAEAEKERKRLQGEGIALEREAIAKGMKESIATVKEATGQDAKHVIALLTLTQYLDTIKSVGTANNSKVLFMDASVGKTGNLMQEIMASMESKD